MTDHNTDSHFHPFFEAKYSGKRRPDKDVEYGGIIDGLIDSLMEKFGVDKKLVEKLNAVTADIMKHVETQQIGDELVVTIHLNKIHFKMKK